ncbi:MobA/MobL family protein [Bradyrhizobium sp. USDA 3364]
MAIYHLHVKNISRRDGRSAVAAAAYRADETLANESEETDSAFGGRRDVLFTEIRMPSDAPAWMAERAKLWNAVEAAERSERTPALPRRLNSCCEFDRTICTDIARQMADVYVTRGHILDLAIHEMAEATIRTCISC